jgi:hypothetical protein
MTTTKSFNHHLPALLLAIAACAVALKLAGAGTTLASNNPIYWPQSRASQLVFFAVLEGLYRDGVQNDDVDLIIPPGKDGRGGFDLEHFVYACPLCHPAFEAFRLYRQREPFYGLKARVDSFGPGLDEVVRAQLRSPDAEQRRQAIQGLVNRWVERRLEMMRLTEAERADITREMEAGRKQGMGMLKPGTATSAARTNCPICDGSFGACQQQAH